MRILTWNINGVRTLPQYHPWNSVPTYDDILNKLEADIICFQEMKSSRTGLTKAIAVPPSYEAFFSFPARKSGYSGVATYTRTCSVVPLKAEEGLCGLIELRPPFTLDERVSRPEAYPQRVIEEEEEEAEVDRLDYRDLDSEGRAVVLDFGLFVLINVYCPNGGNGTEERGQYKIDFFRLLEARVKGLVEREGREVIVVGDMNACAAVIDHCEGQLMVARGLTEGLSGEEGFWGKEVRRRMKDWILDEDGTGGCMVDIMRRLWPSRKGMYTCWNTKISARETNYGTRIDYILLTQGLLPWVKGADIQPHIKGSDHCPLYIDFHDEIIDPGGTVIKLHDVLGVRHDAPDREPPRMASKFWDEYSGKQMLLEKFFGRTTDVSSLPKSAEISPLAEHPLELSVKSESSASGPKQDPPDEPNAKVLVSQSSSDTTVIDLTYPATASPPPSFLPSPPTTQPSQFQSSGSEEPSLSLASVKRKFSADIPSQLSSSKRQKQKEKVPNKKAGQMKLSTFFAKPKASLASIPSESPPTASPILKKRGRGKVPSDVEFAGGPRIAAMPDPELEEDDLIMSASSQESESGRSLRSGTTEVKQAWSSLLAPIQPPKCTVHGEPAKEYTVGKPGPNKGKKFFICSRPVGPGYDKGRTERLREHVDPQWKCDFFKWSSEVRKEMRKGGP